MNSLGNAGENQAVEYLQKNQYKILKRNFRFHHLEVDIIGMKDEVLHGFEVKTWKYAPIIDLEYAVDSGKLRNIAKALRGFCYENKLRPLEIQIDCIFVEGKSHEITHLKDIYFEDGHGTYS